MGGTAKKGRQAAGGAGGHRLLCLLHRLGWALLLLCGALLLPARALAGEAAPGAGDGPVELTAAQMDSITAGSAMTFQIDLTAFAAGTGAVAETQARTEIVQSQLLVATVDPNAPEQAQMRDVAQRHANIAMGTGLASAAGQSDAHCAAAMTVIGEVDFSRSMSTASATASAAAASTAICQCSILAISLMK